MTMDTEIKPNENSEPLKIRPRPVILTVLCLFSFVYFALLSLLFLLGLINTGWIVKVTNQYLSTGDSSKSQTFFIFFAGLLLHGLAFTGILLIWNLRKTGYYLLGISCLVIATYQLVNPVAAITSTAVYVIILFLFGLFFRRMH
jgi:hypothetical protein